MPNWVEQSFAIVGPKEDIDRFCALAVTGDFRRDHTLEDEPTFRFSDVCPIRRPERRQCQDEHETGVLCRFVRTDIQAQFEIQTAWDFPRHFFLERLPRDWPRLAFCCAVNEDMESFGGIVAGFNGAATCAVEDYDGDYDPKAHRRPARSLLTRWNRLIQDGRPWRVQLPLRDRSRTVFKGAATFDDMAVHFTFVNEAECRRFAGRYKGSIVQRQFGRGWRAAPQRG